MGETALVVAAVGLGLSGIVSAIKLIDWFVRSDPKEIWQAGRWAAVGLFVLLIPLLIGLAVNRRWPEAIGLSAVMLLAFVQYGPRILGQLTPRRRLVPNDSGPAGYSAPADAPPDEAKMVQRSIAVLEDYLRRTTGAGLPLMSEAEALEVLGLPPDAEASEINEAHRRLIQLVHPDRGGSQYFAVKVNQAKEILLELRAHTSPTASAAQEERSSRDGDPLHPSESGSTSRR